jgi:enamine deaminase RidA (YjgF/YER057c/UK114 family)
MSEWAPLCIGPYAQANVIEDALIFVAGTLTSASLSICTSQCSHCSFFLVSGQVPLDPVTMQIVQVDDCPEEFAVDSEGDENSRTLKLLHCQLWLACRHAIRVLSALDAKVSTVLCCTLYVNLSLLPPRGREGGQHNHLYLQHNNKKDSPFIFVLDNALKNGNNALFNTKINGLSFLL